MRAVKISMARRNKRRRYDASARKEAARETRRSIIDAARRLFPRRGYSATTMQAVAAGAGVALDTVYATVGTKPTLFRLLVEIAISGDDEPIPAAERDYVRAIHAEFDAARKLAIYATALGKIHVRLAPLFRVLQTAAPLDADLDSLWQEISRRRSANMRLLATELAESGRLRPGLSVDKVADIIWSMNSPEFYLLLVEQCGWPPEAFAEWLADSWKRLLLVM
jgi:AcrR family transcriptional regulator